MTITAAHSPAAYLFSRDMMPYSTVYNKVRDEAKWIELIPNIYYDSYSGLFFCQGLEYTSENEILAKNGKDYVGSHLYYTDGTVTTGTYGGADANILTWTKVTGDYTDSYDFVTTFYARFYNGRVLIDGDGKGNIAVLLSGGSSNLDANCFYKKGTTDKVSVDPRRYFSLIQFTKNGDTASQRTAAYAAVGYTLRGMDMTADGKAVFYSYDKTEGSYVYVYDAAACLEAGTSGIKIATHQTASAQLTAKIALQSTEYNGSIYLLTTVGDVYKIDAGEVNTAYTPETVINSANLTTLGISGTPKGIEFDENGNMVFMTDTTLYSVELPTSASTAVSASDVKVLTPNETYYFINGADTEIAIAPGSYSPHGITLTIGEEPPTEDKMIYTHFDSDEAKYMCDLDGIDVNGIYAWNDAEPGECEFKLTARSADYPTIMKTVTITVDVGTNAVAANTVMVDGGQIAADTIKRTFANPEWIHLEANNGYVFLDEGDVSVEREVNGGTSFAVITREHGESPQNDKYAYVILPNASAEETQAYAENPDVEIIEVSENVHALLDTQTDTYYINVFEGEYTIAGITLPACSAIIRQDGGITVITVSDPTQKLSELVIEVASAFTQVGGADADCVTIGDSAVTVDISKRKGASYSFTLE